MEARPKEDASSPSLAIKVDWRVDLWTRTLAAMNAHTRTRMHAPEHAHSQADADTLVDTHVRALLEIMLIEAVATTLRDEEG